jgi:hypothetical protein
MRRPSGRIIVLSLVACALAVLVSRGLHLWGPSQRITLCGTGFEAKVPGRAHCPDGHQVRRELLLPVSLASASERFSAWGVTLPVLVTTDGLDHSLRRMWLRHPYVQSDTVTLHSGWNGQFAYELKRLMDFNMASERPAGGAPSGFPDWNDEIDPDFRVMDGKSSWTARQTKMRPMLLVPKSGEHIIFLCWDVVGRPPEQPLDYFCEVRDMDGGPDQDQLSYMLYRSRIADWRRYSRLLWALVDSVTLPQ